MNFDAAGRVRDRFFEAAVNSTSWENALGELTNLFDALGATLIVTDKELRRPSAGWVAGKFDPKGMELYLAYYGQFDPIIPIITASPLGKLVSYEQLVSKEFVRRSEFFQDFLIPLGGRHLTCGSMFEDFTEIATLAVQTGPKRGPLETQEIAILRSLWPSLVAAMQVFRRLARANIDAGIGQLSGMLDAFDRMAFGGILIDPFARVLRMNLHAERHINKAIRLVKGRLVALHREFDANLVKLLASVTANRNRFITENAVAIARPHSSPLLAHVMPVKGFENAGPRSPAAIIVLVDPDADRPVSKIVLSQVFGLSAAEVRLANCIARGLSTKDAADELRIGYETARSELKAIFQKTGVHRQSEFVALLGRIAVLPNQAEN